MPITIEQVNAATGEEAARLLDGLYEHSPWIAEAALAQRPFRSLGHLKQAMADIVRGAGVERQLALIRAHPELAGKAMVAKTLTSESTNEQGKAGLADCTPEEFARIQQLNADYNARFGFPFILAVRGPRGTGLTRRQIIDTFARRLGHHPDFELAENLRNIDRIVELRLNDKFGIVPVLGNQVWDWAEELAGDEEFVVGVFNDDLTLPPGLLADFARKLQQDGSSAVYAHPTTDLPNMTDHDPWHLGNRMVGYAFALRGGDGLRADEDLLWWWGDSDLDWRARQKRGVSALGVPSLQHHDPNGYTNRNSELTAQAGRDRETFHRKWGFLPW